MTRNRLIVAMTLLMALLATACGGGDDGSAGTDEATAADSANTANEDAGEEDGGDEVAGSLRIGALYLDAQGYYAGVRAGVEEAAADSGIEIEILESTSASDAAAESSFVQQLVAGGVDAIIISAVSADASVAAIQQAADAGVPVICYNTCINEADATELVDAYVLGDPVAFGEMIGEATADWLDEQGITEPQIGITNCEFVEVCISRREGFEAVLAERVPGYEIVANQQATTVDEAVPVAEQIMSANPDLTLFWGESGGASLGAVRAVEARGAGVTVFGSDMTTEIAQSLVDGTMQAVVDISGKAVGRLALGATLAVLEGETPEGAEGEGNVIAAPIEVYIGAEDGAAWLEAHPDGLP